MRRTHRVTRLPRAAQALATSLLTLLAIQVGVAERAWAQSGVTRDKLSVPLSPTGPQGELKSDCDVTDDVLLESPDDPAKQFYIPRYRLFTRQTTTGETHQMASLQADGNDWIFTVHLEAYPSDALRDRVRDAVPLNYAYPTSLSYTTSNGVSKVLKFRPEDVAVIKGGLRATARLSQKDSDEYYAALSDSGWRTSLTVARGLKVALPVEQINPEAERLKKLLARYENMQPVVILAGYSSMMTSPFTEELLLDNLNGRPSLESGDLVVLHTLDGNVVAGIPGSPEWNRSRPADPPTAEQRIQIGKEGPYSEFDHNQDSTAMRGGAGAGLPGPIHIGNYANNGRPDYDLVYIGFPDLAAKGQQERNGWSNSDSYMAHPSNLWFLNNPPAANGPAAQLKSKYVTTTRAALASVPRLYAKNDFHVCAVNLVQSIAPTPFVFSPRRDAYVFAGIDPPGRSGLIPYRIGDTVYLQDETKLETFYYLADRYEAASRDGAGVTIRATEAEDKYLLEYSVVPTTDPVRLERDRKSLLDRAKVSAVNYLPYRGERPVLSIVVPTDRWANPPKRSNAPTRCPI